MRCCGDKLNLLPLSCKKQMLHREDYRFTKKHRRSNKFLLFLPSVVFCFHLCSLVGVRQREKGVLVQSKWRQKHEEGVLNSLRPVLVGVEGSALGVVLKVTLFPGVRANSLAIYKNTTNTVSIILMLIKSSEKCS